MKMSYNQIHYSGYNTAGLEIQRQKLVKCYALYTNGLFMKGSTDKNLLNRYEKYYVGSAVIPQMLTTSPNNNSFADIYLEVIGRNVNLTIYPTRIGYTGVYGSYKSLIPESLGSNSITIPFSTFGPDIESVLDTALPNNGLVTACLIYEHIDIPATLRPYTVILNQATKNLILEKQPGDTHSTWTDVEQIFTIQISFQRD